MSIPKRALIIYDADPDGIAAGVVVGQHIEKDMGIPVSYERGIRYSPPPYDKIDKSTGVIIVDFSYDFAELSNICAVAHHVTLIDHHQSAKDTLRPQEIDSCPNLDVTINTSKAACVLAWEYCHEAPVPEILYYIQDQDLWTWRLPNSRIINATLGSYPMMPAVWEKVLKMPLQKLLEEGTAIDRYQEKLLGILINSAVLMEIGGHKVKAVNCADPSVVSELGNRLAQNAPFGATFYLQPSGLYKFSIRSVTGEENPIGVEVHEIAKLYGGGGHPNASGFKVSSLFPFEVIPEMEANR